MDKSPSPTSKLQFPPLPFINQAPPYTGPTEHAQMYASDMDLIGGGGGEGGAYSVGGVAGGEFSLRRLPSLTGDNSEETMSFSSLPTSHFTLRPSSSGLDSEDQPTTSTRYWPHHQHHQADLEPWNWHQPGSERSWNERKRWRKSVSEAFSGNGGGGGGGIIGGGGSRHSPAPSSYGSNLFHGTHSHSVIKHSNLMVTTAQQQQQQQVAASEQQDSKPGSSGGGGGGLGSSKDAMSRSSLSVTDSKTIVLTNAPPASWQSSGTTGGGGGGGGGGDKKKELEKLLNQQQQNHRLTNNTSSQAKGQTQAHSSPLGVAEEQKAPPTKAGTTITVSKGDGGTREGKTEGGNRCEGSVKSVSAEEKKGGGGGGRGEERKESGDKKTPSMSNSLSSSASNGGGVGTTSTTSHGSDPTPSTSSSASSGSVSKPASKEPSDTKSTPPTNPSPPKRVVVDVWAARGPASGILSLNSPCPSPPRRGASAATSSSSSSSNKKEKKSVSKRTGGASLESALLITSQFVAKGSSLVAGTVKKKEESGVGGGGGLEGLGPPPPLGGILVRGSNTATTAGLPVATAAAVVGAVSGSAGAGGSRSGSSTPTVLGPVTAADVVATQQKLASIGAVVAAAGVGGGGVGVGGLVGKIPAAELHSVPPLSGGVGLISPPSQLHQENFVLAVTQADVKRTTNSVSSDRVVGVSAGGHVTLSQQQPSSVPVGGVAGGVLVGHTPNAPTAGSNGTNFQEILSSTRLKLAETKEKGLKQALTG